MPNLFLLNVVSDHPINYKAECIASPTAFPSLCTSLLAQRAILPTSSSENLNQAALVAHHELRRHVCEPSFSF